MDRHAKNDQPIPVDDTAIADAQGDVAAVADAVPAERGEPDAANAHDEGDDMDDPDTIMTAGVSASDTMEERDMSTSEAHDIDNSEELAFDIAERLYDILKHPIMPSSDESNIIARRVMRQALKRISTRLNEYISKADPPRKTGLVKATRAAINQDGDDNEYQEYTIFDELRTILGETIIETFWYECTFGEDSESGFARHYATEETKAELAMMDKGIKTVILEMTRQIREIRGGPQLSSSDAQPTEDSRIGSTRSSMGKTFAGASTSIKERKSTGLKSSGDKWEPMEELMCWELFWDTDGKATNRKRAVTIPMRETAFNDWSAKNTRKQTVRQWCAMEQHMNQLIKKEKKTHQEMRDAVGEVVADDIAGMAKALIDSLDITAATNKADKSSDSGIDTSQKDSRVHRISPVSTKRKRRTAEESDLAAGGEVRDNPEDDEGVPEPAAKRSKADTLVGHGDRSHDMTGWQT
ncbi:hypothetical protein LTR86_003217 [Recurvomyces mirabilis]|nr:hypothetical protein LTR86_003217 [Recurvomyces mirabilis]